MTMHKWVTGEVIDATDFNNDTYDLFKGTIGSEDTVKLADNVAGTFVLQPNVDPAGSTQLFQIKNQAGTVQFSITANGTLSSFAFGSPTFTGVVTLSDNVAGTLLLQPTSDPAGTTQLFQIKNQAGTVNFSVAANGNTALAGTVAVTGAATLSSTLAVTGATTLSSTVAVTGAVTLSSTLAVTMTGVGVTAVTVQNTNSGGNSIVHVQNNSGDTNFLQLTSWGSAAAGTPFGISGANLVELSAGGSNNTGLLIGTTTAVPIVFGTNGAETGRAFSSGGWYFGGAGSDPGAGVVQVATALKAPNIPQQIATIAPIGSTSATMDFTSIPSTFGALRLYFTVNGHTAPPSNLAVRFNNDSGMNYDYEIVFFKAATSNPSETFAATQGAVAIGPAAGAATFFGEILIPLYASATQNKGATATVSMKSGTSTGRLFTNVSGVFWRSNTAINRVTLIFDGGDLFDVGSTATLYGVP